jgi:general secretion pathway protein F
VERLQEATSQGHSLDDAIAAESNSLPPYYRAVVAAGARSGRLASALEGCAEAAAQAAELRRISAQALAYPLIVLAVSWALLLTVGTSIAPSVESLGLEDRIWAPLFLMPRRTAWTLAAAAPVALVAVAALWWRFSASPVGASHRALRWTRWIPGVRRSRELCNNAAMAGLLHLLISSDAPLPEALTLAADGTSSDRMKFASRRLADALLAGAPLEQQRGELNQLPPLVRTGLLAHDSRDGIASSLQRAASIYRERSLDWTRTMSIAFPVGATVFMGGLVVGCYAMLLLQPYFHLLDELSHDALSASQLL